MSTRRVLSCAVALASFALIGAPARANSPRAASTADVLDLLAETSAGVPLRFLDTATVPVLGNVDSPARRLAEDLDSRVVSRLGDMNIAFSQHTTSEKGEVVARLDNVLGARLAQLDQVLEGKVRAVDGVLASRIEDFNSLLTSHLGEFSTTLARAVTDVDGVFQRRLADFDEITERRIGNLDTVATRSALTYEEAFRRVAIFSCALVFLLIVAWRILAERSRGVPPAAPLSIMRRLAPQVLLAMVVVGGLAFGLIRSSDVRRRGELLKDAHESSMATSLNTGDLARARYHASQLELLDPGATSARVHTLVIHLIRDMLERPTLFSTTTSARTLAARLDAITYLSGGETPDTHACRAYLLWRAGGTRIASYFAACSAVQALDGYRRDASFARGLLKPLVVDCIRNYLATPLPVVPQKPGAPYDMSNERIAGALAEVDLDERESSFAPLGSVLHYNRLCRELVGGGRVLADNQRSESIIDQYIRTVEKHAEALIPGGTGATHAERESLATRALIDWDGFYSRVSDSPVLRGSSAPLAVFRLPDWIQARCLAYSMPKLAERPELQKATEGAWVACDLKQYASTWVSPDRTNPGPDFIASFQGGPVDIRTRFPIRIRAADDFLRPSVSQEARVVASVEESNRFLQGEELLLEFEQALIKFSRLTTAQSTASDDDKWAAAKKLIEISTRGDLYVDHKPYAVRVFARLEDPAQSVLTGEGRQRLRQKMIDAKSLLAHQVERQRLPYF